MFNDLREYIERVDELGQCRIVEGADWDLEIGRICESSLAVADPPLLLFDRIKGYPPGYRIATNLLNSCRRISLALGLPDNVAGVGLVKAWRQKVSQGVKPVPPVEVGIAPVKENVHVGGEINLFEFPTPKWHERDGGRYIGTADMVIQRDPETGWINIGTYRVQIQDKSTASLNIVPGHHGDVIAQKYWKRGMSCPVAVVCGGDPLLFFAGTSAIPWGMSEYGYAGWIRGRPIEITKGETVDLPIPATAEIVLEGEFISPEIETRVEGPFGEWMGYYSGVAKAKPVIKVTAILHRNEPILGGAPPLVGNSENSLYANVIMAADLWNQLDSKIPGVKGVWYSSRRNLMIVISVNQLYPEHVKQVLAIAAEAYRGVPGEVNARFIIAVDDDIDPSNINEVLWALSTRCDPQTQIDIISDCSPKGALGSAAWSTALIQACKPYHRIKDFPASTKNNLEALAKVREKWGKVIFGETG